jgi:ABC-type uncharacterized transport system permease subunit
MLSFILALVAIAAYATSSTRLARSVVNQQVAESIGGLSAIALAAHCIGLLVFWLEAAALDFQFLRALSLVTACAVGVLLSTKSSRSNAGLGLILQPLAVIAILGEQASRLNQGAVDSVPIAVSGHVLLSVVALGLFSLATLQALLLALQESQIKQRKQNILTQALPPLDSMEIYLFRLLLLGFMILSAALISGMAFTDDLVGQHLIHKTVLTALAWIVMAVLLIGRRQLGWRGKTAVRCTVGGYSLLVLGYFGSKFVLEFVLA